MDATEQAIDQTLRIVLTGTEYTLRISGTSAKHLIAGIWSVAALKQRTRGKTRLESMLKSGKELKVFNVKESELEAFAKEARRFGVLYAVIKSKGESPDELADILVKAEDASKLNRIVERLELGGYDEGAIVIEAQRELSERDEGRDDTDTGAFVQETNEFLDDALGEPVVIGEVILANPTEAETESPSPFEPSSKTDGHQQERAFAETMTASITEHGAEDKGAADKDKSAAGEKGAAATSVTREGRGFDMEGRKRRSVKAVIAEKRQKRAKAREQKPVKPQQARHQSPQVTKRKSPKAKTETGR
jgi:hypothetical protein